MNDIIGGLNLFCDRRDADICVDQNNSNRQNIRMSKKDQSELQHHKWGLAPIKMAGCHMVRRG